MQAPNRTPRGTALVLTGGGARAAYQVGVLQAIAQLRRQRGARCAQAPFAIFVGTSAGAINAAALACGADHFDAAVARIARAWAGLHSAQVIRADRSSAIASGARWLAWLSLGWALARWRRRHPHSLLDNQPLAALLRELLPLERLPALVRTGRLRALAVTASSYQTGQHVVFYEAGDALAPWARTGRKALRCTLTHEHLLASTAIPFVFPAVKLAVEDGRSAFFGDGAMRQTTPIAPAIHLGAERVLVVGSGPMSAQDAPRAPADPPYPPLAQVAGQALSNIFIDALADDAERVVRVNQVLSLMPPEAREQSSWRPVELLLLAPSIAPEQIATRHLNALPTAMRTLLSTLGEHAASASEGGGHLASYLLFEARYTQELMALGYADTLARRAELCDFFDWHTRPGRP